MNDETEGREKIHESVIEENKLNDRKFQSLNFLNDDLPKFKLGEHRIINIVQLAKTNLLKRKKLTFRKSKIKIDLTHDFSSNIKTTNNKVETEKKEIEKKQNFTENDTSYDGFVKRIMYKLGKEKKLDMLKVNSIRNKLPNSDEDYFNILMKQKKRNRKLVLSNAFHDLLTIQSSYKIYDNNNSNLLPLIHKKINSKTNIISRNISVLSETNKTPRIINLYEQVSHNTNKKSKNKNKIKTYSNTERSYKKRRNISIPIPIKYYRDNLIKIIKH